VTADVGVLDRAWDLSPGVSVRPESFGALLYHFGTRRQSFLKDRRLLDVVQRLPDCASAREACLSAGLEPDELPAYGRALSTLVDTSMIVERDCSKEHL
jgi:putative mycofactocin binding protein MftB